MVLCPGLPGTRVSLYQKSKTNLDILEQETMSGSGISWAIYKSAPCPRQITMPAPHHSVFTGWMPFLPPKQQHQSTESHFVFLIESNNMQESLYMLVFKIQLRGLYYLHRTH